MAKKGSSFSVAKIAIGIVLGLLIIEAYRYQQGNKQADAEIAKLVGSLPKLVPAQTQAQRERESGRQKLESEPLETDERCVDGQRFRRAADGWVQNGSCALPR